MVPDKVGKVTWPVWLLRHPLGFPLPCVSPVCFLVSVGKHELCFAWYSGILQDAFEYQHCPVTKCQTFSWVSPAYTNLIIPLVLVGITSFKYSVGI